MSFQAQPRPSSAKSPRAETRVASPTEIQRGIFHKNNFSILISQSHVESLREYPDGVEVPLETRQEGRGHRLAAVVPLPESGPGLKLPIQGEEERALQYVRTIHMMKLKRRKR